MFPNRTMSTKMWLRKTVRSKAFQNPAIGHVWKGLSNNISMRLSRLWTSSLDMQERQELVNLVRTVAGADGGLSDIQREAIDRLRTRLAITA